MWHLWGRRKPQPVIGLCALLLVAGASGGVGGCGGNAGQEPAAPVTATASGRAVLTIRWPAPSRLIPFAANSVKVTVFRNNVLVEEQLVTRPASGGVATATFERVPVGEAVVRAVAYPNADGSGIAQAQADAGITVVAGQATPVKLSLQSTISTLEISPAITSLTVGQTALLTATPRNASKEIVLVTSSTIVWKSLTPTVATVDLEGRVTAVGGGTANIEVKETESGKTALLSFPVPAVATPTPTPTPTPPPGAGLLAYDVYDYPADAIMNGLDGGTGLAGPWHEFGYGYSPTVIHNQSLVYPGLRTSGRAARITLNPQSSNTVGMNRSLSGSMEALTAPGSVLYYSMLIRPLDNSSNSYYGLLPGGLFAGKSGSQPDWVLEVQGGAGQVHTGIPITNNTTLLVVRVAYREGNERVEMWVNPKVGQPLPAANAVKEDYNIGNPEMAFGCNNSTIFDEHRIGRTWESVSPAAP